MCLQLYQSSIQFFGLSDFYICLLIEIKVPLYRERCLATRTNKLRSPKMGIVWASVSSQPVSIFANLSHQIYLSKLHIDHKINLPPFWLLLGARFLQVLLGLLEKRNLPSLFLTNLKNTVRSNTGMVRFLSLGMMSTQKGQFYCIARVLRIYYFSETNIFWKIHTNSI